MANSVTLRLILERAASSLHSLRVTNVLPMCLSRRLQFPGIASDSFRRPLLDLLQHGKESSSLTYLDFLVEHPCKWTSRTTFALELLWVWRRNTHHFYILVASPEKKKKKERNICCVYQNWACIQLSNSEPERGLEKLFKHTWHLPSMQTFFKSVRQGVPSLTLGESRRKNICPLARQLSWHSSLWIVFAKRKQVSSTWSEWDSWM